MLKKLYNTISRSPRKINNLEDARIAVCISSLLRQFEVGSVSLVQNVLLQLPTKPDIFIHTPTISETDSNNDIISNLSFYSNHVECKYEADPVLSPREASMNKNLNGMQAHKYEGSTALQWTSMRSVSHLREAYEKKKRWKYDYVIWCRPDLYYFNKLDFDQVADNTKIYFTGHDNHLGGLSDRFTIGNSADMSKRMRIFEYFTNKWYDRYHDDKSILHFSNKWQQYEWNPEMVLRHYIRDELKLDVEKIDLCFGKIRPGNVVSAPYWQEVYSNNNSSTSNPEDVVIPYVKNRVQAMETVSYIDISSKWPMVKIPQ